MKKRLRQIHTLFPSCIFFASASVSRTTGEDWVAKGTVSLEDSTYNTSVHHEPKIELQVAFKHCTNLRQQHRNSTVKDPARTVGEGG